MTLDQRHGQSLAHEYSAEADGPYLKVRLACCGRSIRWFRVSPLGAQVLKSLQIPPELVLSSAYCADCRKTVKVTAQHLHFAP